MEISENPDAQMMRISELINTYLSKDELQRYIKQNSAKSNRIELNIDNIRKYNSELEKFILKEPLKAITIFENILNSQI